MTNKEIAKSFQLLGDIMELHGENQFKIRSYRTAYMTLRKLEQPLSELSDAEIGGIKGVGKAIQGKIRELLDNGKMNTLERYKGQTPEGVQEMLQIKGVGPKKIASIWQDLGVETVGELLYAVNENRLIELKGFGLKTQKDLKEKLEYYQKSKHQFHFATLDKEGATIMQIIEEHYANQEVSYAFCGAMARKENVLERIEILIGEESISADLIHKIGIQEIQKGNQEIAGKTEAGYPVVLYTVKPEAFFWKHFQLTGSTEFLEAFQKAYPSVESASYQSEEAIFETANLPFIVPELRSQDYFLELATKGALPELIKETDVRGVIHSHTTYSDGLHSLEDMIAEAQQLGYGYIGITDHSKSAFYANGLQPDRVIQQMEEIDQLNAKLEGFRILKGIESDILNDGSLDYEEELLAKFDFIIASVHSNLRMDEAKATERVVKAIENPYTTILGHPTGRLLLSRTGYPLNHDKVIDACAANQVAIELNANPYRLDLDWTWIPNAMEKGVLISINPDAHSKEGIQDIRYGVYSARKGGLSAEACLNAREVDGFLEFCK